MSLTTVESIGTSARLGVARLGATRLGGIITDDQLDKDLDGTYAWKRLDGVEPRLSAPASAALQSGNWTISRGND